ncbi:hypothetical protein GJ689_08905 [Rhodoplanes serenus]|jgi:hypothetical protein|uniref:Uncharacterized protein n=1 Tax=Rhodoplanes serenus TaxID=200615 RepID=A0A327K217_9BRAD|nr:hypothetical protein [Rhodoplanes serenus]MTW16329.1 hypothetical protein [Rhodoplanes serenus]RAI31342.1 hypothetical protein CH340_18965 [Rhodoplanes serenus]
MARPTLLVLTLVLATSLAGSAFAASKARIVADGMMAGGAGWNVQAHEDPSDYDAPKGSIR